MIARHRYLFFIIGFLLLLSKIALADGGPWEKVVVLQESFSEKFPPEGWTLARTNQNHTWESVGSAFDGNLHPEDGFWFAFVQGDSLMPSDELLITPEITVDNCESVDYNLDFYYYSTSILSIEFSQSAYPEWYVIHKEDIEPSNPEYKWNFKEINSWYFGRIGFRFQNSQLSNNAVIALDLISIWCEKEVPEDDDDLNIDDDISYPDDDNSNDDDSGVLKASQGNNSNNHGCGCSMIYENTDVSLFLTLFLVGIGAWVIGNKRK